MFRVQKKLILFQLALGTSISQILLAQAGQVLVCSFNDLVGRWLANPRVPSGQVGMNSYFPTRRIYLSRRTGRHFFQALNDAQQKVWIKYKIANSKQKRNTNWWMVRVSTTFQQLYFDSPILPHVPCDTTTIISITQRFSCQWVGIHVTCC